MRVDGARIKAIAGVVPSGCFDVAENCGESIAKSTGFSVQRRFRKDETLEAHFVQAAAAVLEGEAVSEFAGLVTVSFSARERYPSLAQRLHGRLGFPSSSPAIALDNACAGYPYGLMVAMQLAVAAKGKVLLLDGDHQSRFIAPDDVKSAAVMGDGVSATLIEPGEGSAEFYFHTDGSKGDALRCADAISMNGFEVFQFVLGDVARFVKSLPVAGRLVPHQANLYMIRQLAQSLGMGKDAVISDGSFGNPGSASIPLAIASSCVTGPVTLLGFGAGLSASAAILSIPPFCRFSVMCV